MNGGRAEKRNMQTKPEESGNLWVGNMKKFYGAALCIAGVLATNAANAADIATKAPGDMATPVIAGPSWTGFYLNGGLGYGAWTADTTTQNLITGTCDLCVVQVQGGKGWLGLVGIGYDYQFTSHIAAGLFADYDFSRLKGTIQDQNPFLAGQIKQTSAWAVGARVGWLVNPAVLGYVNGGYSSAHFSSANMINTISGSPTVLSTPAHTTRGWFFGGGLEVAVTPYLFWRNEYRYAGYARRTLPDTDGQLRDDDIKFKPAVQTFTTQLVYKFDWSRY
jgi:outer membrane immunogenic protein